MFWFCQWVRLKTGTRTDGRGGGRGASSAAVVVNAAQVWCDEKRSERQGEARSQEWSLFIYWVKVGSIPAMEADENGCKEKWWSLSDPPSQTQTEIQGKMKMMLQRSCWTLRLVNGSGKDNSDNNRSADTDECEWTRARPNIEQWTFRQIRHLNLLTWRHTDVYLPILMPVH